MERICLKAFGMHASSSCDQLANSVVYHRELKQEAHRICVLDHTIRLETVKLPQRNVDFDGIASEVHQATQYLRGSKFGIDTPRMHEDVGAYYADDVVPTSLHSEVKNSEHSYQPLSE
jgi:hypothetical protein